MFAFCPDASRTPPIEFFKWSKVVEILAANYVDYNNPTPSLSDDSSMMRYLGEALGFTAYSGGSRDYYTLTISFKDPQKETLFRLKYL